MEEEKNAARATVWKKNIDYIFSLIGMMVGLGNIWRFPYLCYKNGGGAFLVAYCTFLIILIFPTIVFESAVGQLAGRSPVNSWKIVPLFVGIGYAVPFFVTYCNSYYAVLLAWGLRWLSLSFSTDLPWMNCDNVWNSNSCYPLTTEQAIGINKTFVNESESQSQHQGNAKSSVEEFWRENVLGITSGIEDLGGIKPDLAICLIIIWTMAYFAIWKGIAWTSKIVYVTATLPFALLIVVVVRGATLEGAAVGIEKYLMPNITKLGEFQVWADAASQVLYSYGTCAGSVVALSAYNRYHHNFFRDSIILVVATATSSFLAGFAIFSVLGYLAHVQGTSVDEVAESGPGLVFVAYPAALSLLPLPQFWLVLFFSNLLFVGFDSMFVYLEAHMACIRELFPNLFQKKWSNETQLALWVIGLCVFGLTMVTRGGIYVLNIFNLYSMSGWCLYFFALMESIAIGWVYGADRMCDDIEDMIGYKLRRLYFRMTWKYIIPSVSTVLLVYSLINYQPLTYDDYVYPAWADVIGWITALNSVLCIPIAGGYVLWKAKGETLMEKYRNSVESIYPMRDVKEKEKEAMLADEKVESPIKA